MNRDEAIGYLRRKGIIGSPKKKAEFTEEDEKEIEKVQKAGKIYGDPFVKLRG